MKISSHQCQTMSTCSKGHSFKVSMSINLISLYSCFCLNFKINGNKNLMVKSWFMWRGCAKDTFTINFNDNNNNKSRDDANGARRNGVAGGAAGGGGVTGMQHFTEKWVDPHKEWNGERVGE